MAFDFSPVGLGLGAASSIYGLIAGSAAQKRAQERRDSIIQSMKDNNAREYLDVMTGNERSLAARTGGLNAGLESTGRSLGAANAAAGVTNSSAVAGSLGLGAQGIQQALARYALANRQQEQQLLHSGENRIGNLELGAADQDLGYERDQNAGYQNAFGNLVRLVGSRGRTPGSPAAPGAGTGAGASIMAPMYDEAGTGQTPPSGYDPITLGGGFPGDSRSADLTLGNAPNPLQSWLQKRTQSNRKGLGALDGRTMGPMMNGMQGAGLPALSYGS